MDDTRSSRFSMANLRAGRSIYLLSTLLVMFIAIPLLEAINPLDILFPDHNPRTARLLLKAIVSLVLVTAAVTVADSARPFRLILLLTAFPVAVEIPDLFGADVPRVLDAASEAYVGCALLYVVFFGARKAFTQDRVSADMIALALCAYLLIGLAWNYFYVASYILAPDTAFAGLSETSHVEDRGDELFYFSFVTLTTLGYGEINPTGGVTRSLAILEATIGQMFVAVVLARLVGLQIASSTGPDEPAAGADE